MFALFALAVAVAHHERAPLQHGETPLHAAATTGQEGAIKVLLEAGADREAKDNVSGERRCESGWLSDGGGGGRHAGRGRWWGLARRC